MLCALHRYLYRKLVPPLVAAGCRVVVPDMIGFGRSDKLPKPRDYTHALHCAAVRRPSRVPAAASLADARDDLSAPSHPPHATLSGVALGYAVYIPRYIYTYIYVYILYILDYIYLYIYIIDMHVRRGLCCVLYSETRTVSLWDVGSIDRSLDRSFGFERCVR